MSLRIGGKNAFTFPPIHKGQAVGFILQKFVPAHHDCGEQPGWGKQECSMGVSVAQFFRDESATTAIEYALIAGTIAIAILAAVDKIGTQLNTTFSTVWTAIK
jgi:pilus assembly protein Flp/PilA